jgi:hypothetical protein
MRWCDDPLPLLLLEAVAQFNRGDYFEQHETLELLWRAEARPVRRLYQGILQIGVAFHHLRRRNYHGVVYMLTRGAAYLKPFAPRCRGWMSERCSMRRRWRSGPWKRWDRRGCTSSTESWLRGSDSWSRALNRWTDASGWTVREWARQMGAGDI